VWANEKKMDQQTGVGVVTLDGRSDAPKKRGEGYKRQIGRPPMPKTSGKPVPGSVQGKKRCKIEAQ